MAPERSAGGYSRGMDDEQTTDTPAEQSAFNRDEPPHAGADDDPDRPSEDLTTEDLGEGGPAGA